MGHVLTPAYLCTAGSSKQQPYLLNDGKCLLSLQADALVEMTSGTGNLPHQYEAVQQAASFAAPGHDRMQFREVAMLIMNLLAQDMSERWSAQDVCKHVWLTEAVAAPFVGCPVAF